jgi:hypothetical protein
LLDLVQLLRGFHQPHEEALYTVDVVVVGGQVVKDAVHVALLWTRFLCQVFRLVKFLEESNQLEDVFSRTK